MPYGIIQGHIVHGASYRRMVATDVDAIRVRVIHVAINGIVGGIIVIVIVRILAVEVEIAPRKT